MSLIASNCHGYSAAGVTGWPSAPTKVWVFGWFKVDGTGGTHRSIAQFSEAALDGTQDYIGLSVDGSNVLIGECSTTNVDVATPDPGNFYFWNGDQQGKWTLGCTVFDSTATASDLKCIFGRAAATAKASTVQSSGSDISAFDASLTSFFVARDRRVVASNSATDGTGTTKVAYIAFGHGDAPTQANIQSCIDGMHPADLAGVFEYWDLTSSGAGLVGALRGITLAPFGGAATATWDGADNPTVSAPTGGGGGSFKAAWVPIQSSIIGSR